MPAQSRSDVVVHLGLSAAVRKCCSDLRKRCPTCGNDVALHTSAYPVIPGLVCILRTGGLRQHRRAGGASLTSSSRAYTGSPHAPDVVHGSGPLGCHRGTSQSRDRLLRRVAVCTGSQTSQPRGPYDRPAGRLWRRRAFQGWWCGVAPPMAVITADRTSPTSESASNRTGHRGCSTPSGAAATDSPNDAATPNVGTTVAIKVNPHLGRKRHREGSDERAVREGGSPLKTRAAGWASTPAPASRLPHPLSSLPSGLDQGAPFPG
jgi:hypothetical protein